MFDSPIDQFHIEKASIRMGANCVYQFTYGNDKWMAVIFYEHHQESIQSFFSEVNFSEEMKIQAFDNDSPLYVDYTTIDFGLLSERNGQVYSYEMTPGNEAFTIMTGVLLCVQKYLEENTDVYIVEFTADGKDKGRKKAYRALSLRFAKTWKARRFVTTLRRGENECYVLIRPSQGGFKDFIEPDTEEPLVTKGRHY